MKSTTDQVNKIWLERYHTLNEHYSKTVVLLKMHRPTKQKLAIWRKDFDKFVLECYGQDKRVRDLLLGKS